MNRAGITAQLAGSRWRRRQLLILCYHGVSRWDEHEWNPTLYVSERTLARRMDLLQHYRCNVLALDEAVERLQRNDLPDRAVVLTFDDGYYDFLTTAYPIIKAHGYPATVYLPTLRCEHNVPVARLLISYMLWLRRHERLDARGLPGLTQPTYVLASADVRAQLVSALLSQSHEGEPMHVVYDAIAKGVADRLDFSYDRFAAWRLLTLLNPAEIQNLSREGVDIQLHTHRHETPAQPERFAQEIRVNRERIVAITGRQPVHFCWPSGVYYLEHVALLEAAGVVSATTCDPGLTSRLDHRLLLPRFIDTSSISEAEFVGWLAGLPALYRAVRPRRRQLSSANIASAQV